MKSNLTFSLEKKMFVRKEQDEGGSGKGIGG